jgi:hypothetical protein
MMSNFTNWGLKASAAPPRAQTFSNFQNQPQQQNHVAMANANWDSNFESNTSAASAALAMMSQTCQGGDRPPALAALQLLQQQNQQNAAQQNQRPNAMGHNHGSVVRFDLGAASTSSNNNPSDNNSSGSIKLHPNASNTGTFQQSRMQAASTPTLGHHSYTTGHLGGMINSTFQNTGTMQNASFTTNNSITQNPLYRIGNDFFIKSGNNFQSGGSSISIQQAKVSSEQNGSNQVSNLTANTTTIPTQMINQMQGIGSNRGNEIQGVQGNGINDNEQARFKTGDGNGDDDDDLLSTHSFYDPFEDGTSNPMSPRKGQPQNLQNPIPEIPKHMLPQKLFRPPLFLGLNNSRKRKADTMDPQLLSANDAKFSAAILDSHSLLHNSCKLYPDTTSVVESALRMDPDAIRRAIPMVCNAGVSIHGRDNNTTATTTTKETKANELQRGNCSLKQRAHERYEYPINIALKYGASLEILELLAKEGPDVLNLPDGPDRGTSLTLALALERDCAVVSTLLKYNATIASTGDRHLNYPLHIAVRGKKPSLELVKMLHQACAKALSEQNFHRETPLDIAIRSAQCPEAVVNYLQSHAFEELEEALDHL